MFTLKWVLKVLHDVRIEVAVKTQRGCEMIHQSQVTVTTLHKAGAWNCASWIPHPLCGYKGFGALTLPSQMKAERFLGTQLDDLSMYLWSYQCGGPVPWETTGYDVLTSPMGVNIERPTSHPGFVSTTPATGRWCERYDMLSWAGVGNIKDRDIALPSYKIMILRGEDPSLIRLKVWQGCPRSRALHTVSWSRDAFCRQESCRWEIVKHGVWREPMTVFHKPRAVLNICQIQMAVVEEKSLLTFLIYRQVERSETGTCT